MVGGPLSYQINGHTCRLKRSTFRYQYINPSHTNINWFLTDKIHNLFYSNKFRETLPAARDIGGEGISNCVQTTSLFFLCLSLLNVSLLPAPHTRVPSTELAACQCGMHNVNLQTHSHGQYRPLSQCMCKLFLNLSDMIWGRTHTRGFKERSARYSTKHWHI